MIGKRLLILMAALLLCASYAWAAGPSNVLVVINENSPESREIGAYYVQKRKVPAKNVCRIKCSTDETLKSTHLYRKEIEPPVKDYLAKTGLSKTVDYIVVTKGVPLRLPSRYSVDSLLMHMDTSPPLVFDKKVFTLNPYYGKNEHFSRKKYGFYLVTRLDGRTAKDAKALVDRSLAAKPQKGVFLVDSTPQRNATGFVEMNTAMIRASKGITEKGYVSESEESRTFVGDRSNLMGYFSWGSNDASFDVKKYRSLRFHPGAIAETAVSTSARSMSRLDDGGQSQITDLIEAGVTGAKGYVFEPTLAAIAEPTILFDRYLSGYNLAESFYMASKLTLWKDVVIGDPLCAPYAKR